MARRDYAGNAVPTTLTGAINTTDLSISINDATGWPSGGASGKFFVTVDRGLSNEERILVASRTGTTLTVTAVGDRGVDDTAAATHGVGASIEHTFSAVDADEANQHIFDTVADSHVQYLNIARHDVEARHQFGAALGTPSAATDIGTAAAAGTGDDPAREDHVHKIGAGAINDSGMFAAGIVDAGAIAPDAVGTSELAPDSVTTTELLLGSVTTAKLASPSVTEGKISPAAINNAGQFGTGIAPIVVAAVNPGAIGAHRLWLNTTKPALLKRHAANLIWEVLIDLSTGTDFTPTLSNITLGTGGINDARYRRVGNNIIVDGFISLGTGGNVTGFIEICLPVPAALLSGSYADEFYFHGAARATDASAGNAFAGVGVIGVGTSAPVDVNKFQFITTTGGPAWTTLVPFDWAAGDRFSYFIEYIPASLTDANYE